MPLVEQEFLKPGSYRIGGELRQYSTDDLKAYKDGTVKAIKAGLRIPVLSKHAELGSPEGGPQPAGGDGASALDNVGWLQDIKQTKDGALVSIMDVTNADAQKRIEDGSVKFTSPELTEDFTDGKGRSFGRMIRHMALTPTPRNPDQGNFKPAPGEAVQFSMDDYEDESVRFDENGPPDKPKPKNDNGDFEDADGENGDSKDTNVAKTIAADLEAAGIAAPEGVDPVQQPEEFLLQLCAALRQKAMDKAESDAEESQGELNVTEEGTMAQFDEKTPPETKTPNENPSPELKAVYERMEKQDARIAQFEEEKRKEHAISTRARGEVDIKTAKIPPAARQDLLTRNAGVQFTEDGMTGGYSPAQVAVLMAKYWPKNLQFDEDKTEEAKHPEGSEFFSGSKDGGGDQTDEEEEAIVAAGKKQRWTPEGSRNWVNPVNEHVPKKEEAAPVAAKA